MKTIRTKCLSLLLALVTILSLLPTAAFAASNTGSGLKITTNQAYWSTRLLANGTPYSYRPPLVDGKLVYCMDSGLGYHYATPSYLNSFTWTSGTGADADAVLQSAVTNSGLSEMDAATVENVKWMMTYLNDCKSSNVGQLFMAVQTYVWENQSYKGEPGGDGDAGGYANADTYELYLSLIDSLLAKKAAEDAEFQRQIEEYKVPPKEKRTKKEQTEQPLLKRVIFGEERPDLTELEAGSTTILDILAPTTVDTKSKDYIVVDGVYHTYLYITGYGYATTVGSCWLAPLVEAGEGVNMKIRNKT